MKNKQTKELEEPYKSLYRLLPKGSNHPVTTEQLAKAMHMKVRRVRVLLNGLVTKYDIAVIGRRKEPRGYFIATTKEEVQENITPLVNHTTNMKIRLDTIQTADLTKISEYDKQLG